jgi:hypothetical protein
MRRVLVAVEVALSVVLLSGAVLLFETLWHMQNDHLGFRPEHSLTIRLRAAGFQGTASDALTAGVLAEMRRIPGTEAAALTQCTPLSIGAFWVTFSRSDRPLPERFHRGDNIGVCGAGPDYLKAAGTRPKRSSTTLERRTRRVSSSSSGPSPARGLSRAPFTIKYARTIPASSPRLKL